jgi:2-polyprenyl-6-methoxyphenol hydroxylase-like FAD-dependent oxidoreductase
VARVNDPKPLDVLVVGAGPTGLTLAGELFRRGLTVRVVDKLDAPTTHSKAIGIHARSLEILDDLGVADELVARGVPVEGVTMSAAGETVMSFSFDALDTRYPFILCLSQVETEAVLGTLVARRAGRDAVERGKELVSFTQDEGGVDAILRSSIGEERVRAAWIVGCDGAHSAVRHAVGAAFEGHTYEETFLLADVKLDPEPPKTRVNTYFAEDGVVALFPLRGDRWRVILTAAETLGDAPTLEDVAKVAERRVGRTLGLHDATLISPFRIHCRQVERYRHGRALLAGDAAHIHSPIGGQGMNTGIQDAHNLAWKLALVQRGKARDELMDSYHAERHGIGKKVLAQTDFATKMGTLKGLLVPIRNQVARFVTSFEPVRRHVVRDAAELTVGYEGSPIVKEHVSPTLLARLGKAGAAETPTVASRMAFAGAPKAGARVPDAAITCTKRGSTRLAKIFSGDAFTLLLFDGRSASAGGYSSLVHIARGVRERWGDRIASYLVTPRAERPADVPDDVAVLLDPGEVEARFGAATECLYLVRPDLYVGFRSQPANGDALDAYLASLFV